jgi:hypothetical protein
MPVCLLIVAFWTCKSFRNIKLLILTHPVSLFIVAFWTRESFRNVKLIINTHPVSLLIVTLAGESFCHIPITIQASPINFFVSAFASESFRVIEVTVVASPASFFVAAFAGESFSVVPPKCWIESSSASLHCVSFLITNVTCCTGPVCLLVLAGITGETFFNSFLAILAIPLHSINFMLITE